MRRFSLPRLIAGLGLVLTLGISLTLPSHAHALHGVECIAQLNSCAAAAMFEYERRIADCYLGVSNPGWEEPPSPIPPDPYECIDWAAFEYDSQLQGCMQFFCSTCSMVIYY